MKRILIVDDEPHVVRVLKLALERAGYLVDQAGDGKEALEYLQRSEPDVLITDIDMPRMTGRELCTHIDKELPDRSFQIFCDYPKPFLDELHVYVVHDHLET